MPRGPSRQPNGRRQRLQAGERGPRPGEAVDIGGGVLIGRDQPQPFRPGRSASLPERRNAGRLRIDPRQRPPTAPGSRRPARQQAPRRPAPSRAVAPPDRAPADAPSRCSRPGRRWAAGGPRSSCASSDHRLQRLARVGIIGQRQHHAGPQRLVGRNARRDQPPGVDDHARGRPSFSPRPRRLRVLAATPTKAAAVRASMAASRATMEVSAACAG